MKSLEIEIHYIQMESQNRFAELTGGGGRVGRCESWEGYGKGGGDGGVIHYGICYAEKFEKIRSKEHCTSTGCCDYKSTKPTNALALNITPLNTI